MNGILLKFILRKNIPKPRPLKLFSDFCNDVGIPKKLKSDCTHSFCGWDSNFLHLVKKKCIVLTYSEPERTNQIYVVDLEMRDLKQHWHHKMVTKNVPKQMWVFGLQDAAKIMQFLTHRKFGWSGYEMVTGNNPDISE